MNRLATLLLLLSLAACGNLTAGGIADVDVTVSGDAPDPPAAAAPIARSEPWPQDDDDGDEAEGELEAIFRVALEAADGELIPLTDGDVIVDVDIQGMRQFQLGQRSIPAQTYAALRIYFDEVDVEVDAGLIIDGVEVTGPVEVDLEAEDVEVVRPLTLILEDGDQISVLLDLNAQDWLFQVDPNLSTVPQEFFENAVTIQVQ